MTPLTVKLFGKFDLSFDDLDDVVASFVEPLTARFRAVVEHERFIDGMKDAVEVRAPMQATLHGAWVCFAGSYHAPECSVHSM